MELEEVATHDPYFVERGLYPNVDFYSGITLRALGVRVCPAFCHASSMLAPGMHVAVLCIFHGLSCFLF
jgi:hypothetical protein